jgi:hypothetical protein
MEYKRYLEFYNNENAYEFHTYLPIQMDATCNGFQHLADLSFLIVNLIILSSLKICIILYFNLSSTLLLKLYKIFNKKTIV